MDLVGFAWLAAVLVAIPGPAVTLVMKQSLVRGRPAAIQTALGVLVADLFWVASSVVGLTALIVRSQALFELVRFLGAAYLCWLGLHLLLSRRSSGEEEVSARTTRRLRLHPFAEGAVCDLSNPKTLLVFTSVIPQFLPADGGTFGHAAVLGLTFALLGFASLMAYAVVFGRIRRSGIAGRAAERLTRLSGAVLVLFGVRLATEER